MIISSGQRKQYLTVVKLLLFDQDDVIRYRIRAKRSFPKLRSKILVKNSRKAVRGLLRASSGCVGSAINLRRVDR